MVKYRYSYQTIERYDKMVSNYHFMVRCTPMQNSFQHIDNCTINMLSGASIHQSADNFGNTIHYGSMMQNHDIFVVASTGIVSMSDYFIEDCAPEPIYKTQSHYTHADKNILEFNSQNQCEGTPLERALHLSQSIFDKMEYSPKSTDFNTKAHESFSLGKGVCQDYTHILLSLCRENAIFARYVVGFVEGTGETHSWAEIHSQGKWYGVDPTHNKLIHTGYIKVSHGRDAADCSVIRGIRQGMSTVVESQIRVIVEQI